MNAPRLLAGIPTVIAVLFSVLFLQTAFAQKQTNDVSGHFDWTIDGHVKYRFGHTGVPADSILQDDFGNSIQDHGLETRLKLSTRHDHWDFSGHMQLIGMHSDRLEGGRGLSSFLISGSNVINDDRRWFNLTHELTSKNKNASLIRLDRLYVGYTGDKTVVRFGRQAISWGNGLLFTPMDILNPFDPAAVDKEYKTGDDMFYTQYLQDNGHDSQFVVVVRRDPVSGQVEKNKSSLAIKYHGFLGGGEYDLLAAQHYGEGLFGLGYGIDLAGAIWRGDLVFSNTDTGNVLSSVLGVGYSWVAGGHNWSGLLEYFYSGFGQKSGDYSPADLAANPELLARLARGELYNLGRHYLGASVTVELTPLLNLTPNMFINLVDPSALTQLVLTYDWKQDLQFLGALNLPIGPSGSEYGGIESAQAARYFSTDVSIYAQLSWYF